MAPKKSTRRFELEELEQLFINQEMYHEANGVYKRILQLNKEAEKASLTSRSQKMVVKVRNISSQFKRKVAILKQIIIDAHNKASIVRRREFEKLLLKQVQVNNTVKKLQGTELYQLKVAERNSMLISRRLLDTPEKA